MIKYQGSFYAPITRLSQESYGLLVTAENGSTTIEFVCGDPTTKRELTIGKSVRIKVEVSDT